MLAIVEYYQRVFFRVVEQHHEAIRTAWLDEPRRLRLAYCTKYLAANARLAPHEAWEFAKGYLGALESAIEKIVEKHSVFYWIHLYRRIGVSLIEGHEGKTDANTLGLVRAIAEAAIAKFGRLDYLDDIRLGRDVGLNDILGGLYAESLRETTSGSESDLETAKAVLSDQWVLTRYSVDAHIDMFRIEGLAYEYWRATAMMRSFGKGASLVQDSQRGFIDDRTDELHALIASYDRRIDAYGAPASSKGLAIFDYPRSFPVRDKVLVPVYNAQRIPFHRLHPKGRQASKEFIPNFQIAALNLSSYLEQHSFMRQAFFDRHGVDFEAICTFVSALSFDARLRTFDEDATESLRQTVRLYQRAYLVPNVATGELAHIAIDHSERLKVLLGTDHRITEEEAEAAIDFLTLSKEKQASVSLWSMGPRYLFVPHGELRVWDLAAIWPLLSNLFFGIRVDQQTRGPNFERAYRALLTDRGFDVLPDRDLINLERVKRETDVAVRRGDTLYLIDCRSIERPLDYDIGKPATISTRIQRLKQKATKVRTIGEFVRQFPLGHSYDFSWAKRVVSIGVSPFVEWIWSLGDDLWVSKRYNQPVIMESSESLDFLKNHKQPRLRNPAKNERRRRKKKRKRS